MHQPTNVRVTKFLIYETKGYANQYRRAYTADNDGIILKQIEERVAKTDRIRPGDMVGIANQFLKPSDRPEDYNPINIVNGWNAPRCRWYMEVEYDFGGLNSSIKEVFMGYTDLSADDGTSMQNNAINPDMVFYMNNVTHLKHQRIPVIGGIADHFNVTDSSQILNNNNYGGARVGEQLYRMRPDDLFSAMMTSHLDFGSNHDARTAMTPTANKATRTSTIAPAYMARVLDTYLSATAAANQFGGDEPVDILGEARSKSHQQSSAATDPFMRAVSSIENGGSFSQNFFTYRTLCSIDPNADNIAEVCLAGDTQWQKEYVDGFDTNDWSDGGTYVQFASILSQSVPTLMMECGLRRIWFTSTNRKLSGQIETGISNALSFSPQLDINQQGDEFIRRINEEILWDISFNNEMDYMLEMRMTMHGEVELLLALNGDQNPKRYVTPLFTDSLTTHIVTGNLGNLNQVAQAFGDLAGGLAENNLLGSAVNSRTIVSASGMAF